MADTPSPRLLPKPLRQLIHKGRCVAFVGAGFSMPCGMPNWTQLLRRLHQHARDTVESWSPKLADSQAAIDRDDLPTAAGLLKEILAAEEISSFMRDQFSRQKCMDRPTHSDPARLRMQARIDALIRTPLAGVITTNFDDLIPATAFEWVLSGDEAHLGFVLARGERFLVRLHSSGWHTQLVLTRDDYVQAYLNGGRIKTIHPFLNTVMMAFNTIFIGCSLEPSILNLRRKLHKIFKKHLPVAYALLPDTPANRNRSIELLSDYDIRSILYELEPTENPDHIGVDRFLDEMAAARDPTENLLTPSAGSAEPSSATTLPTASAPDEVAPASSSNPDLPAKILLPSELKTRKTVVELDLIGYSTISASLEENVDVTTVAQVNAQIQGFVDCGLEAVGATRETAVMVTTGDGAILVFEEPATAHDFAAAVQQVTAKHNRTRQTALSKRVFRIGAATGEIMMIPRPGGGFDIAGTTIAYAVRLEAKARPGELLVDLATYENLRPEQRALYGPKRTVAGKRDEQLPAHGCLLDPEAESHASFTPREMRANRPPATEAAKPAADRRREIIERFKTIRERQQCMELTFLLAIPVGQRPPETMGLDDTKSHILQWASDADRQQSLLEELRRMTESSEPS